MIAFTDGGIFGLGLGNSIQKYDYIPEANKPHEEVDSPDHEEAY